MSRTTRCLATSALAVAGVLVLALWPAALGGSVSFISTRGSSMEPHLRQNDLVLLRRAREYGTGDVVGYRSPTLGGVTVLHRIVDRDDQGFVTKGDNNAHLDPDRPTAAAIIGREWARVPGAGPVLGSLKVGLPLVTGGLMLLARRKRRGSGPGGGRRNRPAHLATAPPRRLDPSGVRYWKTATLGGGAVAAVALALALVSFTRPAADSTTEELEYTQRGTFSYRADVPEGAVYTDGSVDTGEPVFLRMVRDLDFVFEYDFESAASQELRGTIGAKAVLSNSSGWRHEVTLQEPQPFQDDDARVEFALDLRRAELVVAEFVADTGIQSSATDVAVVPEVTIAGTVDGKVLSETFAPSLSFQLDALQLRSPLRGDDAAEAIAPVAQGSLTTTSSTPRHLAAFGQSLPVATGRALAVGLSVPAILVAAAGLLVLQRRLHGEAARIELRHGHRMVPVTGRAERAQVVEVRSIQDLARMAEQYQSLILHREGTDSHDYELPFDGVVYRYRTKDEKPTPSRLLG